METVQGDITYAMRAILVDWLVEVGEEYKLQPQTLYLAIHYVDRLLSIVAVNRAKLQLVGITCMLVAAKYEEIYPPTVNDFVYISDGTYKKQEVMKMESVLLTTLGFALTAPTSWEMSKMFIRGSGGTVDPTTAKLADVRTYCCTILYTLHSIPYTPICLSYTSTIYLISHSCHHN
jgi:cyclin A